MDHYTSWTTSKGSKPFSSNFATDGVTVGVGDAAGAALTARIVAAFELPYESSVANEAMIGQLTMAKVVSWMPWILPIVLANGLREELLYRGLFLKKFESLLGNCLSGFLQALIFSLSHSVAGIGIIQYTPYISVLVVTTFILGLVLGYVMRRTDSIIGPILLHAGTDIPIFIGIFSNIQ